MITLEQVYKLIEKADDTLESTYDGLKGTAYGLIFSDISYTIWGLHRSTVDIIDNKSGISIFKSDDIEVVEKISNRIKYQIEQYSLNIKEAEIKETQARLDEILN